MGAGRTKLPKIICLISTKVIFEDNNSVVEKKSWCVAEAEDNDNYFGVCHIAPKRSTRIPKECSRPMTKDEIKTLASNRVWAMLLGDECI
jgi:hypothetical protein